MEYLFLILIFIGMFSCGFFCCTAMFLSWLLRRECRRRKGKDAGN